jgi:hypothetical protein
VNETVTPVGAVPAARAILPVKPYSAVELMSAVAVPPAAMLRTGAEDRSVKVAGGVTLSEKLKVLVTPFAVAEKLTGNVPVAALLVAWNETEAEAKPDAGAVMLDEENVAVTPLGRPEAASVIAEVNPFAGPAIARLTAELVVLWAMVAEAVASVKLNVKGVTESVIVAVGDGETPVLVPVIVMV